MSLNDLRGFDGLIADLQEVRRMRANRAGTKQQAPLAKSLEQICSSLSGMRHPHQQTKADPRAAAETLCGTLDELMVKATSEFKAGRITGNQLSQFEILWNRQLDGLKLAGRL